MTKPFLTIGMAVHEDFHGAFFTINALRMYHDVSDCELVVVDNSPNSEAGTHTGNMVRNCASKWASAKYIAAPEVLGTSAPRDRVFTEATGEYVICMDCHVLLWPGAIDNLKRYYRDHPGTSDLLSGPLVFDSMENISTHFSPRWREEMEGTWGLAWRCKCGQMIDVIDEPQQVTTMYRALMGTGAFKPEYRCNCGQVAPACPWGENEKRLIEVGWQPSNTEPFEIPGQGLGFFSCRREAWLGFNPAFRGFGGEELYIHRKFRQAGHKALCLPSVPWYHRFAPAQWTTYDRSAYCKARNYYIGHMETGIDPSIVRAQFPKLTAKEWSRLAADPIANEKSCSTCGSSNGQLLPISEAELPKQDRERFTELIKQHLRVAIVGKRDWWKTVAKDGGVADDKLQFFPVEGVPAIEDCDLLIIHSMHHADRLYAELQAMAPKTTSRILLRSTGMFGEEAEGGGPGLLPAMRRYMRENPEWSVIESSNENWGYVILSRLTDDKPKLPGKISMAVNLAKAVTAHVADGMEKTPPNVFEARLNRCSWCEKRIDDRCSQCGCFLIAKASMKSSECPLGRWDTQEEIPATSTGNSD